MPVYEYVCKACDHEWEQEQRISDDPVKTCPRCKARKAKRLISRTSFVLKGSGWYSDLYSSSKKDAAGGDDKGGDAAGKDAGAKEAKDEGKAKKASDGAKSDGGKKPGGPSKGKSGSGGDGKAAA